jgi:hypothetical protein
MWLQSLITVCNSRLKTKDKKVKNKRSRTLPLEWDIMVVLFKKIIQTLDIVTLEQFYFTTNLEKNKRFNPVTSLVPFALCSIFSIYGHFSVFE